MEKIMEFWSVPWIQSLLILSFSIVLSLLSRLVMKRVLLPLAQKTETDLDDKILLYLRGPVSVSVILLGLFYALKAYAFPEEMNYLIGGALMTAAVALWSVGLFRVSAVFLDHLSHQSEKSKMIQPRTLPVFTIIAQAVIIGGAAYFFFLAWDLDVTGWLASAGVVGIAVGFAAKDTLANLFAGLFIIADAPYKIGDYLILGNGDRGRVTDIGLRSTRILTRDHVQIIVPNSLMSNQTVINQSGGVSEDVRLRVSISVSYNSEPQHVTEVLVEVAKNVGTVLDRPGKSPVVRFVNYGESSLMFELLVWIAKPEFQGITISQINTEILRRFKEAEIIIPFPQRELHLNPGDAGRLSAGVD